MPEAWIISLMKGTTMFKKIVIVTLILAFTLSACSVLQSAQSAVTGSNQSSQNTSGQNNGQGGFGGITANTPIDSKLAIGLLKLEGTPQAITPAEAKNLLPLWQALKSLSASPTTAPEEVTAVFQQIQDTLTPEQLAAVKQMALTQTDMQALMKSLNIQSEQGFGGGGTLSPAQQATRTARQTQNPGGGFGGPGGGFGGPGGPGGGFGGPDGGNGGTGNSGSSNTRPTASPQQLVRRSMGMNLIFIDPLIKLLETRAATAG
jgi:hypothetical protein